MWETILLFAGLISLCGSAGAANLPSNTSSLYRGFQLLYDLDFEQAHQVFQAWHGDHPEDPLAPASEAAGLLFSEFNRLGVLESQFYANDQAFAARRKLTPDPAVRDRFNAAVSQAETLAQSRLSKNRTDPDAMFTMALSSGLRADYAALIEKHNLASLHFTRQATSWAQQFLAIDPEYYDAHLATGISQYIIGSMSPPVRWLLRMGGVAGDKQAGIQELKLTALHGRYLAPFARILLAIAYVREKDRTQACELLISLRDEFPQNPLFAREITRLDSASASAN